MFNSALFSSAIISKMADTKIHPSMQRLYEVATATQKAVTPSEVARLMVISQQRLKNWDIRGISKEGAVMAQAVFGVSPAWLLAGNGPMLIDKPAEWVKVHAYQIRGVDDEDGIDPEKEVMIPVYDIEVSAGNGIVVPEFVETRYKLPYQIEWLKSQGAKPQDILIAKVNGPSMEPVLFHGDKVVIHTGKRRIRNNAVFSLIYGGEARVKRLFTTSDNSLRIVSDNPDKERFPDEIISPNNMESIYIIGQVIDKMGSGGLGI